MASYSPLLYPHINVNSIGILCTTVSKFEEVKRCTYRPPISGAFFSPYCMYICDRHAMMLSLHAVKNTSSDI